MDHKKALNTAKEGRMSMTPFTPITVNGRNEMEPVMMKCGHATRSKNARGELACPICLGLTPDALVQAETPTLATRYARCGCGATRKSAIDLPFFEHRPGQEFDSYYCGCRGWD